MSKFVNKGTLEQFVAQLIQILTDVKEKRVSVEKWKAAWKNMQSRFHNPVTGNFYNGMNVFSCLVSLYFMGGDETRFITFKEAVDLAKKWGMEPTKDNPIIARENLSEKGTPIMYWGRNTKEVTLTDGTKEEKTYFFVTGFRLHNLSLFSPEFREKFNEKFGEPLKVDKTIPKEIEKFVEEINKGIGATVEFTNEISGPHYIPSLHKIRMPYPSQYLGNMETLKHDFLHEAAHATKKVCGRNFRKNSPVEGDAYALEEIVAETAAYFVCLELGVDAPENSINYILGWLQGNTPTKVMSLLGKIDEAVSILLGRWQPKNVDEKEEVKEIVNA